MGLAVQSIPEITCPKLKHLVALLDDLEIRKLVEWTVPDDRRMQFRPFKFEELDPVVQNIIRVAQDSLFDANGRLDPERSGVIAHAGFGIYQVAQIEPEVWFIYTSRGPIYLWRKE